MINAAALAQLHDDATSAWHHTEAAPTAAMSAFFALALEQHRANFDLWHREDAARDPLALDADIAAVKHAIDKLNQQRNDLVEQLDQHLFAAAGQQNPEAPLHSETPGLMIDRLSILALKLYHTAEEAHRLDATPEHRARNQARLNVLTEQRSDLAGCLQSLWTEVLSGHRRFKLYRQMKMYNDPTLNPVLYAKRGSL